ncbi:MAG: pyridoxal phosphate-dependent aminotransferase family protein [Deltaproteobacteria bacterium]|nr:pyridoxal phosphate-dependent aminotransferase family protein [Deltaproteobacteria bacterium]
MGLHKLGETLSEELTVLHNEGRAKGKEDIITKVIKPHDTKGPRFLIKGYGEKEFLKMNSNSYLGMSLEEEVIQAEEEASRSFGVGPGAVRFINGTYGPHRDLEKRLAAFHNREDAVIFSAAYATMIGVFVPLTTDETIIISDELNHNCIINSIRLSRPKDKKLYRHLDLGQLESHIKESIGYARRVLIITDGVFSMRGDYAPLNKISGIIAKYNNEFPEDIIFMVDDSHGVGAFGKTGRGTEEITNSAPVDILIGTLGKAFGVNGGYVTTTEQVTKYFREKSVTYIYSNPITVGEAAAAHKVIDILNSEAGIERLAHLSRLTEQFENGLKQLGFEIIESEHPIVPLMARDTETTINIVNYLKQNGILATGLNFPVVPKGDQCIRFQVNANHTESDIKTVLSVLEGYKKQSQ